jgi:hypothetical protein
MKVWELYEILTDMVANGKGNYNVMVRTECGWIPMDESKVVIHSDLEVLEVLEFEREVECGIV